MPLPTPNDFAVSRLAVCRCRSPLSRREEPFVNDTRRVLVCSDTEELQPYLETGQTPPSFEMAGPRAQIFFEPSTLTCGILTCGGLCPGLNNVIRSIVLTLTYAYGVPRILGSFARLVPETDRFRAGLVLAVAFGANIGGVGTPIGTPPNAIAFGALHAAGYPITFLIWVLVVVPLELVILAVVGGLLYACFKPGPDMRLGPLAPAGPLSGRAKVTLLILGGTVVLWLTSGQHGLQPGPTALLAAAALTALGVLDHHDVDAIDWNILILMWGGLSLGVALEQSGLMGYVQRVELTALPGGPWAVGLSTFMSNTASAALLVPMALAVSLPGKEQFALLVALACSFAMALPVSTPPNAMAYATGAVSVREMWRAGGLISAIAIALLLLGYQLMLPLLFRA